MLLGSNVNRELAVGGKEEEGEAINPIGGRERQPATLHMEAVQWNSKTPLVTT